MSFVTSTTPIPLDVLGDIIERVEVECLCGRDITYDIIGCRDDAENGVYIKGFKEKQQVYFQCECGKEWDLTEVLDAIHPSCWEDP